ncbi:MAG TPA: SOS response-associated peptidase [Fimbriimonadaceae bacterium]|nr:SOS response-associated peptidase [Fimbriimonadaceae bacterium]
MCSRFCGNDCRQGNLFTSIERGGIRDLIGGTGIQTSNQAPTELAQVLVDHSGALSLIAAKWGFPITGRPLIINARAETVLERGLFADAAKKRRCLIPVSGFYEWDKNANPKQPFCFRMADESPFALAGLWRRCEDQIEFVICTTEPNELLEKYHNRMPSIIDREEYGTWLFGETEEAVSLAIEPFRAEKMKSYAVTRAMGNPRYKSEDAHQPVLDLFGEKATGSLF